MRLKYFKLQRSGIENESSHIFIHSQIDSSYKSQFCTKVRAPSRLVLEAKVRAPSRLVLEAWAKYKDVRTKIIKRPERTKST